MSKSYRIRTKPGEDDGYLKVNLDLNQHYDFLEILSLKISQTDEYQNFCADYGVIAGRIDINNGFGVPNVKVSIFVPIEEADLNNPVISSIYPYTSPTNDEKNDRGIRYNLLPNKQQTFDHTPVGTFPSKREMLDNGTTLEIYEKYYKYTTTTNQAGDFILFGVPVGEHTLHYDMDVSDIGFISSRPYELIAQGYSEDLFDSRFKFKSSNNLDNLTQIYSQNISVTVHPYWCDSLSVGSTIGIVRKDISIDLELIPTAIFMGSIFSDDEKDSVNKNCRPDKDMGKMNDVITGAGKLEAIRRTIDGTIESYEINGDAIDDNGNWSIQLPMNLRKVITDEFGNLIPSPDGIKGIATEADFRFRVSMDKSDTDKRLRQRVKFLVPNLTGNYNFGSYSYGSLQNTDHWKINEQLSTITQNTPYEDDLTNQYNYIEDFFTFRWKKVYTVKQYIGRFQKSQRDETRAFIGIKDIVNGYGVNKFPSNRVDTNIHPLYSVLCFILSLFAHLVGVINGIIQIINGLITALCKFKIPFFLCISSNKGSKYKLKFEYQNRSCALGVCVWGPTEWDWDDGFSDLYDPLVDFTGNGSLDPGDFDGGLGTCNDTRDWYPAQGPTYFTPQRSAAQGGGPTNKWPQSISKTDGTGVVNTSNWSSWVWSTGDSKGWIYPGGCTSTTNDGACRRWKLKESGDWRNSIENCNKDPLPGTCDDGIKFLGLCIKLKFQCLFAGIFCDPCQNYCGDTFSCTGGSGCGSNFDCCDDKCCIKIPLIGLKCKEEDITIKPTILKTPFAKDVCNDTYVKPYSCWTCGGLQTPIIKDWVSCVLEPVAVFLKMLKFDFYNDWVSGSLYFPLIKRKYKVRKSKKKFGQIKKDKFCHYNCLTKNANPPQFQGYATFLQDRIKLDVGYSTPTVTIQGCSARLDANIVSDWYGDYNSNSIDNLNLAAKQIVLDGTNDADKKCQITFDNYASLQGALNNISGLQVVAETKVGANPFGEPDYVKTIDQFGTETWENQGGFGLHKNKCDPTRMIERGEYFKNSLDCWNTPPSLGSTGAPMVFPPDIDPPNPLDPCIYNCLGGLPNDLSTSWQAECCRSTCGTNSVAGCNAFCSCRGVNAPEGLLNYNGQLIEHGLIMWYDQELYYTSIIPKGDYSYNDLEYKANIMLPTTITELGSTTYCDIDDVPFIMDKLQPTTFQVSYEAIKYKIDNVINNYTPPPNSGNPPGIRKDLNYGEDKEGALNLRGYVDFSCLATTCLNTPATVNQSQIGVDTIDTNDLEIEISNCFMRFEHDTEIREYFCRRFSGYKDGDLNVHYMRPGSNEFENDYQPYDEITLVDGTPTYYRLVDDFSSGDPILSTYNDGDAFVPGDACGFYKDTNPTGSDYFYGLAPGQTSSFVNFPNPHTPLITFGQNAHSGGVDDVDDGINGSGTIYGIKFNRSQTPYYLYFGLLPGKTALHKTVGKFFADKINAVTLQGIGASNDDASENTNNQNNLRHEVTNPFSIYKTCLGETLIASQTGGGGTPGGSGGVNTPGGNIGNTTPIGIGGTTGLANPPGGGLSTGGNVGSNSQTTPTTTITNYTISGTQGVGYGFPSMAATALINVFNAPAVITLSLFGGTFCPTIPPISNSKGAGGLNLYNGGTTTLTQPNVAQIGMSSNLGGLGVSIQNGTSTVATADEIKTITITINQTGTYDLNLSYSPLNCNQDGYFKIL